VLSHYLLGKEMTIIGRKWEDEHLVKPVKQIFSVQNRKVFGLDAEFKI
jgi:hypothetical protein